MSHAANLRNRQRPTTQDSPAKRRRIEPAAGTNGINAIVNGTSSDKKFIAIESTDVKRHTSKAHLIGDSKIGHGEQEDALMLDAPAPSGSEEEDDEEEGASSDSDAESADSEDEHQLNGDLLAAAATPADPDADSPTTEPSFGDLLRARAPTQINVEPSTTTVNLSTAPSARALTIPTATSLGTVLTQALRTNDIDLLESCLQVANLDSIRATIERLHSSLATTLLHKLAERLHRRPGRAGSLMVWVQWTIVAHGGYLASQPASVKQLHTLYNVVKQRAAGLQPLLTLKGKLDMLEAQMRLRQSMQDRVRPGAVRNQDEAGVVYVEGEEDAVDVAVNGDVDGVDGASDDDDDSASDVDDDSEVDELAAIAPALAARAQKKKLAGLSVPTIPESDDDEEDEDDMPDTLPNGVDGHDDEEGSSDDEDDAEGLLDDEAEESGDGSENSELDEEDIDYDDEDLIDDDSSEAEGDEEEAAPIVVPVKAVSSKQRKGSKRK